MNHLNYAFDGKNQLWRYIVLFILAFVIANTVGVIPLVILIMVAALKSGGMGRHPENMMDFTAYGIDPNVGLAAILFSFLAALIGFALLLKPFHKRTLTGTINGTDNIRWERIFTGFGIWAVFSFISVAITYLYAGDAMKFQFRLASFVPLFFISLLFIPFQTSFEEITIRGYLMQGAATHTHSRIWALIITSLIFGLLHSFNPEVKEYGFFASMPQYMGFGAAFALITLLDDGVELAMGMHAANNFFSAILLTNKHSAFVTPAIFETEKVNVLVETVSLFIFAAITIFILSKKYRWNWRILTQPVTPENKSSETVGLN